MDFVSKRCNHKRAIFRKNGLLWSGLVLTAVLSLSYGGEYAQAEVTEVAPSEERRLEFEPIVREVQEESSEVASQNRMVVDEGIPSLGDGTVELSDDFTASQAVEKSLVDQAMTSADYLEKEYEVFPTPQKVTYGENLVRMDQGVHLVIGENIDIYTRNRLKEVLQDKQISYTTGETTSTQATNIYLGISSDTNSLARSHQEGVAISSDLYDKIDAYSLVIKQNGISVIGKDTDAVFYGLTTLKHMLKESPLPVLREIVVEDYADVKNRGFIEGYYGNPWSNADRAELMRYGGDLKLTQYFFAPKDDPYHNSRWRDLYPEEKLSELRDLARAGNQSKTRYVWTIHPFMHHAFRFDTDEHYQEDLDVVKAKFSQLMDVGVREFGILADDAPAPTGGYESYTRLMRDMTNWLIEKQTDYEGLRKEMIFVPGQYWGNGREAELQSLNHQLPESSTLTLTGGKIWGEVSSSFLNQLKTNITQNGEAYRPVSLWINWPCTDNSKQHLILGGGEKFLHPNVNPSLLHGIMLNPMQQSEPSKIALFSAAEYTWNIWKSEGKAKEVNEKAFHFADHGTFAPSASSTAFKELGKHMINQNMDHRVVKLEESVELAPKLAQFLEKLKSGEDVSQQREELKQAFSLLKASAQLYKASGNTRMVSQIHDWLDNTVDQMTALESLLDATQAVERKDKEALWQGYSQGLKQYNQSKKHQFWYVDHYESAELGVQHIRPFIMGTLDYLAKKVEENLDPTQTLVGYISNRSDVTGTVDKVTDGNLQTDIYYTNGSSIAVGDYVGLQFNKPTEVHSLSFAMGRNGNLRDTFETAKLQYQEENGEWKDLPQQTIHGNEELISIKDLHLTATGIRLIATADKSNTWLGVREISVNQPVLHVEDEVASSIRISPNIVYKYNTSVDQMRDHSNQTEAMFADADTSGADKDTIPVGAWVQLELDKERLIHHIQLIQGQSDKLRKGVLEYSSDGENWTSLTRLDNEQTFDQDVSIRARYVRVRNEEKAPIWWRIAEFNVSTTQGVLDYTDTNQADLEGVRTIENWGEYTLSLPADNRLAPGNYVGLKLDRIRQLTSLRAEHLNPNLSIQYSPNQVEWYDMNQLDQADLARYVRIVNTSDSPQALGSASLQLQTLEIYPPYLDSTSLGVSEYYGSGDVRNRENLHELFDGDLNNVVSFTDFPRKNGDVVLSLGTTRQIKKIRAYIKDATINYLRDGKIQVSADGEHWTDVVTVGDGHRNKRRDDSLTDGWTHDAAMPGNRYIEGSLAEPVEANYLRVLFTADYLHRFLDFSEIVINDGEYVKEVNNSVVFSNAPEERGYAPMNLIDKNILTSYKPNAESGQFVYRLSEGTKANHIRLISNLPEGVVAHVFARVTDRAYDGYTAAANVTSKVLDLGRIDSNFSTFVVKEDQGHLLDVLIQWENGRPEFNELATYYEELDRIAPVLSALEDISIDQGQHLPTFTVTAEDNVDGVVPVEIDNSAVRIDQVGTYPIVFTATDKMGNVARKTIQVTVRALVSKPDTPDEQPEPDTSVSLQPESPDSPDKEKSEETEPHVHANEEPSHPDKDSNVIPTLPQHKGSLEVKKPIAPLTQELKDYQDPSGVKVTVFGKDAKVPLHLVVEVLAKEDVNGDVSSLTSKDYQLYEIHFEKEGKVYQIQDKALVGIALPEGKSVQDVLYLLPIGDDLARESLPFTTQDGMVYFEVSHFSIYALVFAAKEDLSQVGVKEIKPLSAEKEVLVKRQEDQNKSNQLPRTGQETSPIHFLGLGIVAGIGYIIRKRKEQ